MTEFEKRIKAFTHEDSITTEEGFVVEEGQEYTMKGGEPGKRYPVKILSIYWDPVGFNKDSDGLSKCRLRVEAEILDGLGNSRLEGRHRLWWAWNVDYWLNPDHGADTDETD